jgi:cytochrome c oxidase assembly factor CtaG
VDQPSLLTSWTFEPLQLVPVVILACAYAMRARTLARRGQPVPGWRTGLFALGICLLLFAVASPIAEVGETDCSPAHGAAPPDRRPRAALLLAG